MSKHTDEEEKLVGHSYDGIDELDNALPRWWLNGFYISIVFAVIYSFYYMLGDGPTLVKEYEIEKVGYENAQLLKKASAKSAGEEELVAVLKDPVRVKAGHALYQSKCLACHGAQGQGGIGPNLTDSHWLHGGKMTQILNVVNNGVLDKGMPPWSAILKPEEAHSVVAFIKSLRGTNPAGAKPPQGELVEE